MKGKEPESNPSDNREKSPAEMEILNIRGELYKTRLTKKFKQKKKWELPNKKHLLSYIPGTVCNIYIKAGDRVEMNGKILILEAMKMQNIILSPIAGRVKSVHVKEGDKIRKGTLMVEFE
jgi:biotin carboxyl carrier protein